MFGPGLAAQAWRGRRRRASASVRRRRRRLDGDDRSRPSAAPWTTTTAATARRAHPAMRRSARSRAFDWSASRLRVRASAAPPAASATLARRALIAARRLAANRAPCQDHVTSPPVAASRARDAGPQGPVGARTLPRARARLNADTSAEPEGLTRRVMLNILEAFFRRPWLHLLPLILMLGLGAVTAFSVTHGVPLGRHDQRHQPRRSSTDDHRSRTRPGFTSRRRPRSRRAASTSSCAPTTSSTWSPRRPAQHVARAAARCCARTSAESISAFADGDSLVRVGATTENPDCRSAWPTAPSRLPRDGARASEPQSTVERVTFLQPAGRRGARRTADRRGCARRVTLSSNPVADADGRCHQQVQQVGCRPPSTAGGAARTSRPSTRSTRPSWPTRRRRRSCSSACRLLDEPELPTAPEPRLQQGAR